jgi:Family of unknown function (DUF6252)
MTAKVNNVVFEANSPLLDNVFSEINLSDKFPLADFVTLQGRKGGVFGSQEINIMLKRVNIAVGTYPIVAETMNTPPSHFIDLIDNSNTQSENTKSGTITITNVNTSTKMVKGTFDFVSKDGLDPNAPVNYTITDGKFEYKYAN